MNFSHFLQRRAGVAQLGPTPTRRITSMADQGWKVFGKSCGRGASQSRCAAAQVESRWSKGFSRWSAARCREYRNSRSLRGAAIARGASRHFDDRLFCVVREFGQRFFLSKFENALYRGCQIAERLTAVLALACRFRHFRTGSDEVFFPLLDNRRVPVLHDHTLVWPCREGNLRGASQA